MGEALRAVPANQASSSARFLFAAAELGEAATITEADVQRLAAASMDANALADARDRIAARVASLAALPPSERQQALRRLFARAAEFERGSEAAESRVRRNLLATYTLAFGRTPSAARHVVDASLEDHYVASRLRFNDIVIHPIMRAARQQPDPTIFGPNDRFLASDLLTTLLGALTEGLHLRRAVDPLNADISLAVDLDGSWQPKSLLGVGLEAVRRATFVDAAIENIDSAEDQRRPVGEPVEVDEEQSADLQLIMRNARERVRKAIEQGVSRSEVRNEHQGLADVLDQWPSEQAFHRDLLQHAVRKATPILSESARAAFVRAYRSAPDHLVGLQRAARAQAQAVEGNPLLAAEFLRRLPIFITMPPISDAGAAPVNLTTIVEDQLTNDRRTFAVRGQILMDELQLVLNPELFETEDAREIGLEILGALVFALHDGLRLREKFDPVCNPFTLAERPGGERQAWTPFGFGLYALLRLFLVPKPNAG